MIWPFRGMVGLGMCGAVALAACGGSTGGPGGAGGASSTSSTSSGSAGDAQTPPQGASAVQAWLAKGDYKSWKCEAAVHAGRSPSPHGFDRICSNMIIETNATGTGTWPEGAAAVKELYASLTATTPDGYAVYLKTAADSAAGASWYWYEQVPASSTAPHDAHGIVADGLGTSGPALSICVGCHSLAGMDMPSPGSRDFVFTPVH